MTLSPAVQRLVQAAEGVFDMPKLERALNGSIAFAEAMDELYEALKAFKRLEAEAAAGDKEREQVIDIDEVKDDVDPMGQS